MTMRWSADDRGPEGLRVSITGSITEDSDFRSILNVTADRALNLDLGGIEQLNSCGVREWIHFARDLGQVARSVSYHRCSPAIVRQLNMISNFKGDGVVRSVLLPYYCGACWHEERMLLETPVGQKPMPIPEAMICPKCGEEAEFDDLPDSYLGFMR